MLGVKGRDFHPIAAITLDDLVADDHFYRHLEQSLDLAFARDLVADYDAPIGRLSIDPVVFFKPQLIMFFKGIRSERQLIAQAVDRLSVRWRLGYDLDAAFPDHSSLTRIRDRFGPDLARRRVNLAASQPRRPRPHQSERGSTCVRAGGFSFGAVGDPGR